MKFSWPESKRMFLFPSSPAYFAWPILIALSAAFGFLRSQTDFYSGHYTLLKIIHHGQYLTVI